MTDSTFLGSISAFPNAYQHASLRFKIHAFGRFLIHSEAPTGNFVANSQSPETSLLDVADSRHNVSESHRDARNLRRYYITVEPNFQFSKANDCQSQLTARLNARNPISFAVNDARLLFSNPFLLPQPHKKNQQLPCPKKILIALHRS
jgi:hypothetical protein